MIRKNLGVGGAAAMLLALVIIAAGCGERRRWGKRHDRIAPSGEPHAAL